MSITAIDGYLNRDRNAVFVTVVHADFRFSGTERDEGISIVPASLLIYPELSSRRDNTGT